MHFPMVGEFSLKFSITLAAKLLKKLAGCKNGTDLCYHRVKYDGDRRSRASCRPKCDGFFYLYVTLSNDKVCTL